MNTLHALHCHRWLALGLGLAAVSSLFAQSTGTIQGRVYNPSAQQYVRNAEVRLEGTNQVTYTENDGSFQFDHAPVGPVTVSVNFTGYNTAQDSFTVTAGQPAVREINLVSTAEAPGAGKDAVVKLTAFTVSSEREGNAKAIMAQRRDMNIITAVSSDIFGDVTDGNVGEFLKYLPGVDLDYVESEARGPRLGGMDGQYVGVSFDGMRSASADANRGGGSASRATSFEGFSITSIESIEINRTASPENDADSPAGTVNMRTKRAFDRKGRTFTYNFGANFNGEEYTLKKQPDARDNPEYRWKPNWQLGYSESFFDQKFGILLSASRGASYTEENPITMTYNRANTTPTDQRPAVIRQIEIQDGGKFITKDALLLTADWKATPRLVLSLNLLYSYFEGEFWSRSFQWVAANDNANVNNGRSTVGGDGLLTVIAQRNATANVAQLNNTASTSAKLQYNRQYAPRFEYKLDTWVFDGGLAFSKAKNNYEALERGFSNNEAGSVPGGFIATRPNPESWEWTIRQTSGADWFDLHSFVNTDARAGGTRVNNDDRLWITEKWSGTANARWAVPFVERFPTVIKFGGKWDEETRKNNTYTPAEVWSYIGPGGNTVALNPTTQVFQNVTFGNWANVGPQFLSKYPYDMGTTNALAGGGVTSVTGAFGVPPRVNRAAMADLYHQHPELFVNTTTPDDYYNANIANKRTFRQTITAGYVQADVRLSAKLQLRTGVRMERTENDLTEFDPLTGKQMLSSPFASQFTQNPTTGVITPSRAVTIPGIIYQYTSQPRKVRHSQYDNYFPSLLLKYDFLPNLEFQAGVNKAIGRPPIDNLTGLWVVNESNLTVSAPNPRLLPEHHKVYQSRLAYYFGGRSPGQASVAFSQDEATNFIRTLSYTASEFGIDDPDFSSYTFNSTTNSTELQRYRNFDFNYSQTLGFLPSEYLRGLNIGGNYARSYANQRRAKLAPRRVTARLGYAYGRFNGSVGVIWIDNRPQDAADNGRFWGALTKIDLALTWRLTRYASLYVQARNISNVPDRYYESPLGVPEGQQRYLRQMEEYGDNWVFGVKGQF